MSERERRELVDRIISWSVLWSGSRSPGAVVAHFSAKDRAAMNELRADDFNHPRMMRESRARGLGREERP